MYTKTEGGAPMGAVVRVGRAALHTAVKARAAVLDAAVATVATAIATAAAAAAATAAAAASAAASASASATVSSTADGCRCWWQQLWRRQS
eukprot:3577937-Pleurochrysis_carterae.AAC.3